MKTTSIDRSKEWTVDEFLQLEESNTPCELINGEVVMSPSPTPYHQNAVGNLYELLKAAARKVNGKVFMAPLDLFIDQRNVFQPDLIYISPEKLNIISGRGIEGIPDLLIEVISPHNIFNDRNRKKKAYQQMGVLEYWIVDPAHKTLEVYRHDQQDQDVPHLFLREEGIVTSTVLPGVKFNLKEVFVF